MDADLRRELISRNLGLKPINHGLVYTFQIAIPDYRKPEISVERRHAIEQSLSTHKINLVSLVLRRTSHYENEEIEYEVVYGSDWLSIAQELDLEKVWAWVFDLTDEQANDIFTEMSSFHPINETPPLAVDSSDKPIDSSDSHIQQMTESLKTVFISRLDQLRNETEEKFRALSLRLDRLNLENEGQGANQAILDKLDAIAEQLNRLAEKPSVKVIDHPINLVESSDQEIEIALQQANLQRKHIHAALNAIRYWKDSAQGLTWDNLERSVRASKTSKEKIDGFAQGTYKKLRAIAVIPDTTQ